MTKNDDTRLFGLPSLHKLVIIVATVITVALGLEARVASQIERNYVSKVDYIQKHEELRQQLMIMRQELDHIKESVDAIRKQVE